MRLSAPGSGPAAAATQGSAVLRARAPAALPPRPSLAAAAPPAPRTATVLLRAAASSGGGAGAGGARSPSPAPRPSPPPYPSWQEEHDVSHEAFLRAFKASHPVAAAVPGLQEFAAALLERRRSIPSTSYPDPLAHVFAEADADGDGLLSAAEVSAALRSRGVDASPEIVGRYIRCARDAAGAPHPEGGAADERVARGEFPAFVLAMASADLHHHGPSAGGGAGR